MVDMQASQLILAAEILVSLGQTVVPHFRSLVSDMQVVEDWVCRRWGRRIEISSRGPSYMPCLAMHCGEKLMTMRGNTDVFFNVL